MKSICQHHSVVAKRNVGRVKGAFLSTQHAHYSQVVLRTAGPCTAGEAPASLQATIPLAVYASAFTDCQWMTKACDIETNRLWCNSTCESVRRIVCARFVSATCCSGRKGWSYPALIRSCHGPSQPVWHNSSALACFKFSTRSRSQRSCQTTSRIGDVETGLKFEQICLDMTFNHHVLDGLQDLGYTEMLVLLVNQVVLSFYSLQSNAIHIDFSSIKVRVCLIDLLSNGWKLSNKLWNRDSLQTSDRFLLAFNDG